MQFSPSLLLLLLRPSPRNFCSGQKKTSSPSPLPSFHFLPHPSCYLPPPLPFLLPLQPFPNFPRPKGGREPGKDLSSLFSSSSSSRFLRLRAGREVFITPPPPPPPPPPWHQFHLLLLSSFVRRRSNAPGGAPEKTRKKRKREDEKGMSGSPFPSTILFIFCKIDAGPLERAK